MKQMIQKFVKEEDGASMVEYILLLALIAIVAVGAVTVVGTQTKDKFNNAANALGGAPAG